MNYTPFMQQLTQLTSSENALERVRERCQGSWTFCLYVFYSLLIIIVLFCIYLRSSHTRCGFVMMKNFCQLRLVATARPNQGTKESVPDRLRKPEREQGRPSRTAPHNAMTTNCYKQLAGVLFKSPS